MKKIKLQLTLSCDCSVEEATKLQLAMATFLKEAILRKPDQVPQAIYHHISSSVSSAQAVLEEAHIVRGK